MSSCFLVHAFVFGIEFANEHPFSLLSKLFTVAVIFSTIAICRDGRDLKRKDHQCLVGPNFHLFFNPSPNLNSPPLDSIIPTQVKTRNYL